MFIYTENAVLGIPLTRPLGSRLAFYKAHTASQTPLTPKYRKRASLQWYSITESNRLPKAFVCIVTPSPSKSKQAAQTLFHRYNRCCYQRRPEAATGWIYTRIKAICLTDLAFLAEYWEEFMKQNWRRWCCRLFAERLPCLVSVTHSLSICTHTLWCINCEHTIQFC